jgi:opacity protein-like surface antigen
MRKFLLLILTGISFTVLGQENFIGIQSGLNLTNLTAVNKHINKNRQGIIGGFNYEYKFKNNFVIGVNLLYIQQGYKEEYQVQDPLHIATIKSNYDYFSFPIKFGYTLGHKFKGFANIGVCPSVLLKAEILIPKNELAYFMYGEDAFGVQHNVSKFDLGGLIELGACYKLDDKFELFSSLGYRKSLTTFSNADYYETRKMRHFGYSLSIGLKYKLKEK